MPIIGLTDRGLSFPEIGQIRKGIKVEQKKGNKTVEIPKDLDYFRVEFDVQEQESAARFLQVYGEQPQEINIILPFDDIDQCWDAWLEAYTAGMLVARADGQRFQYWVDTANGEVKVKNGIPVVPYQDKMVVGQDYQGKDVFCRPVGRLQVIIPELKRAAYLTVHTTSIHDIANIGQQLEAIKKINDGVIKGIPLVLRRRPKKISVPKPDGQRVRMEKWLLSIEADPVWVEAKLGQVRALAQPGQYDPMDYAEVLLPEIIDDDLETEQDDIQVEMPEDLVGTEYAKDFEAEARMSWEMAKTVKDPDGNLYDDLETEKLFVVWGEIQKYINKNGLSESQLESANFKKDAIESILAKRQTER